MVAGEDRQVQRQSSFENQITDVGYSHHVNFPSATDWTRWLDDTENQFLLIEVSLPEKVASY